MCLLTYLVTSQLFMQKTIKKGTASNFTDEVLSSPILVLVEFTAPWCKPCREMAPYIDRLAEHCGSQLKIIKINVDEELHLAQWHQIRNVPAFAMYNGGVRWESKYGAMTEESLVAWVGTRLPKIIQIQDPSESSGHQW